MLLMHRSSCARRRVGSFGAAAVSLVMAPLLVMPGSALAYQPAAPVAANAPAAAPERLAIESVLAELERAVLAGDGAAYLSHVVPADGPAADPIFRKEQENWAKDLKDHAPAEFDLAIVDPGPDAEPECEPRFWTERAEFEMRMTWRLKAADGAAAKRQREVSMPVVFVNPGGAGWLFAGERWVVVEGEADAAVRAKCPEGFEAYAREAVRVFPDVRAHVEEGFEQKIPHVQEIKVYATMAHLQASIYLSYTDGLAGWNEPGESIKILGGRGARRARVGEGAGAMLKTLLAHEFGHVATFECGPKATDMPWWVLEGAAELASQDFSPGLWDMTDRTVRDWAKRNRLAPWEDITDFRTTQDKWQGHVYRQGQHMIGYISTRFGRTARNNWLRAMAQGRTLDEATREVLKVSFAELDAQWRADLEQAAARRDRPASDEDDGV